MPVLYAAQLLLNDWLLIFPQLLSLQALSECRALEQRLISPEINLHTKYFIAFGNAHIDAKLLIFEQVIIELRTSF